MLNAKQKKAVELMASGANDAREIASAVGVSDAVLEKWRRDENFRLACTARRKALLDDAAAQALLTLTEIMRHSTSDRERLAAAKEILDRTAVNTAESGDPGLHVTVSYGSAEHGDRDTE